MAFIEVTAIGNLTRDPELRVTPKGSAICQFGIAANKKWKDDAGATREEVTFVDCEAWAKTAENLAKFFKKGDPIYIRGSLKLDTWEDKTTQQKRSKHKIVIERFEFIGARGERSEAAPEQAAAPAPRQQAYPPRGQQNLNGVPPPRNDINDEDVPF